MEDHECVTQFFEAIKRGPTDFVRKLLLENRNLLKAVDTTGQTLLHIACFKNDSELVALLLSKQADFHVEDLMANLQDVSGYTALHYAVQNNNVGFIKGLIRTGANLELANGEGLTPLHFAIQCNHLQSFFELLEHNADIYVTDNEGNTPLHTAVINDYLELTVNLVLKNAIISCQNINGQTPVHIAFERNHPLIISVFQQSPQFPSVLNIQDTNGNTLLHIASMKNNHEIVEDLVSKGAKLDLHNHHGYTALHIAIQGDCMELFKKLTYCGANVNLKDQEGRSPLHVSVSKGVLSVVETLVQLGADLELTDNHGNTPIHYAAKYGFLEVLKFLHFSGAKIFCINNRGQTLMHVALESCVLSNEDYIPFLDTVKWLLYMGADVYAQDIRGETAIHYAARKGFSILKCIKEHQNVDFETLLGTQNEDGQTALHVAALHGWKMFDDLLSEKADPYLQDSKGFTPFDLLMENYNQHRVRNIELVYDDEMPMIHYCILTRVSNILSLLLDQNLNTETKFRGITPLIYAVERGFKKEVRLLIKKGADVNAKSDIDKTALYVSVENNRLKTAQILICNGADVDFKYVDGRTALHLALMKKKVSSLFLRTLLDYGAKIDVFDSEGKTPLDYISQKNRKDILINILIRHNLVMLKTVNMLSIPADFQYNRIQDFRECCLKEVELMKVEMCGVNSLYDIFLNYRNPTYIFNSALEKKVNSLKICENENFPIYASLLKKTFKRAKDRYQLLQEAQSFLRSLNDYIHPKLPDEIQRMVLFYLSDHELELVVKCSLQLFEVGV